MVTFFSIDEITIPGVYNEMHFDVYKNVWVKASEIKVINKSHIEHNGSILSPKDIYDIACFTEENGSWKYELQGSENQYLHSDGKVYDTPEQRNNDLPF